MHSCRLGRRRPDRDETVGRGYTLQTGFWPSCIEYLAAMFAQLAKQGLAKLIEQPQETKTYYKKFHETENVPEVFPGA